MKLTDQQKHDQLKAAGLLDSTFTQLTRYYGQLLRLDFGTSRRIQSGVSVVKVIGGKFAMSMQLGLISFAHQIPYSILLTDGGSRQVERFFSVPGMGSVLTDAINRYDTSVVQTLVILYAALGIIGVFLGDVLMMIIDPRITLTGKGGTR